MIDYTDYNKKIYFINSDLEIKEETILNFFKEFSTKNQNGENLYYISEAKKGNKKTWEFISRGKSINQNRVVETFTNKEEAYIHLLMFYNNAYENTSNKKKDKFFSYTKEEAEYVLDYRKREKVKQDLNKQ